MFKSTCSFDYHLIPHPNHIDDDLDLDELESELFDLGAFDSIVDSNYSFSVKMSYLTINTFVHNQINTHS